MNVSIPDLCLVVLVGPSGSGKSTLARRLFRESEVLSSDTCRQWVSDDESDQSATADAFDVLNFIAGKRLARQRLTVVDATSVRPEDRAHLVSLARDHDVLPIAIVLNLPPAICLERNEQRPDRHFGPHVVRQQHRALKSSLKDLRREGFRQVIELRNEEEVSALSLTRQPLLNDLRHLKGPFDIIGDVHGCFEELLELLTVLGYTLREGPTALPPPGRQALFLGDLVDRGPDSPNVLRLVMNMVKAGYALCVPGNHDRKLLRKLSGRNVSISHGLEQTLEQLQREAPEFVSEVADFLDGLISHYVLDGGRLVVAHAGMKQAYQGRASSRVRDFALYGETTGETDEYGLPERLAWAEDYRGPAMVVYGHTPVLEPEWVNRTVCIDTGCVFGGRLTALRYPEKTLHAVPARQVWYVPSRPLEAPVKKTLPARPHQDLLDIKDVLGKRIIRPRLHRTVTVREENASAALEVMSRFGIDPHWLIYLPPTMAPSDTCREGPSLEHPSETFAYFREEGVEKVLCQEKHMGSRAVIVLCQDEGTAKRRFQVSEGDGVIYTRTGRPFFARPQEQAEVLGRLRSAMSRADLFTRLKTDWVCIDAEIMPWSVKAHALLQAQYAPTGAAAKCALRAASALLRQALERGAGAESLLERLEQREVCVVEYQKAYRRYSWQVSSVSDLKIAPFHLMAGEGHVYVDHDHLWHMETLGQLCDEDPGLLRLTPHQLVTLGDEKSEKEGIQFFESLTSRGGEGMVVKPLGWLQQGPHGLVQPALKCRGREYLRIIYGPEYTLPEHLERLRKRGVMTKRALALRELSLGLEGLWRFVEGDALYRVHECVFGVLALESEPVDPRL